MVAQVLLKAVYYICSILLKKFNSFWKNSIFCICESHLNIEQGKQLASSLWD